MYFTLLSTSSRHAQKGSILSYDGASLKSYKTQIVQMQLVPKPSPIWNVALGFRNCW